MTGALTKPTRRRARKSFEPRERFHLTKKARLELRAASKAAGRGEHFDMHTVLTALSLALAEAERGELIPADKVLAELRAHRDQMRGGVFVDAVTERELAAAMAEADKEQGVPVAEVFAWLSRRKR